MVLDPAPESSSTRVRAPNSTPGVSNGWGILYVEWTRRAVCQSLEGWQAGHFDVPGVVTLLAKAESAAESFKSGI
jgi:hypothetical protein